MKEEEKNMAEQGPSKRKSALKSHGKKIQPEPKEAPQERWSKVQMALGRHQEMDSGTNKETNSRSSKTKKAKREEEESKKQKSEAHQKEGEEDESESSTLILGQDRF